MTVLQFFEKALHGETTNVQGRIRSVFQIIGFEADLDRTVKSFSGGQQARLLLAASLILEPDIFLLDEPTNNLDKEGIETLTNFIIATDKTCVVISHDEDFLNSFSDSVLYIDSHKKKVEQYHGNYNYVKAEINKKIQKDNQENSRALREAKKKKDQAGKFANKVMKSL